MIEKTGIWFYDSVAQKVFIIKQNWDFFFEDGNDKNPDLNDAGEAHYVIWGGFQDILYANRSRTCLSLEEACSHADNLLSGRIDWSE